MTLQKDKKQTKQKCMADKRKASHSFLLLSLE